MTIWQAESEASTSWDDSALPEHIIWAPGKSARQLAVSLQRAAQKGLSPMAARVAPEVNLNFNYSAWSLNDASGQGMEDVVF